MRAELKFRSPSIRIAEYFETPAGDMISAVRAQKLEGAVANLTSTAVEVISCKKPGSF